MRSGRGGWRTSALLLVGLLAARPGWAAGTMDWQTVDLPVAAGTHLAAIWGSGPANIFVVGDHGTIVHFDGVTWTKMTSGTTQMLYAVWGAAANDVFVVGDAGTIRHYDGAHWSPMANDVLEPFYGVWGSGPADVYAVGSTGTVAHYDGTSWSSRVYRINNSTPALSAIWGTAANNIYVVGSVLVMGAGEAPRVTILHYDGAAWYTMATTTAEPLLAVWGSGSNNIVAAGNRGVIVRFDGADWAAEDSGVAYWLEGVWGTSASNIYAVGGYSTTGAKILHYDGSAWSQVYSDDLDILFGVWGSGPGNIYATTSGGKLLHYINPTLLPTAAIEDPADEADASGTLAFTVRLSKAVAWPVTVRYATADGTATAGTDYDATSGTLVIAGGDTTGTISVATHAGSSSAGGTFTVTLRDPAGATLGAAEATGTVPGASPSPNGLCATAPAAVLAVGTLLWAGRARARRRSRG